MDHLVDYKPICTTDSEDYHKVVAEERIFKSLEGLHLNLDPVHSHILGIEPLPSLQEAFAYVQNEESHHSAMILPTFAERYTIVLAS